MAHKARPFCTAANRLDRQVETKGMRVCAGEGS
jgi:hypothetical protein